MHDVAAASEILSQRLFPLRTAISIPLLRPPRRILVPVPVASRRPAEKILRAKAVCVTGLRRQKAGHGVHWPPLNRSVATLVTGCSKDCKIKRVEIDLECIAGYTCFSPTNREIKATCAEMEIVQKEKVKPTCHEVGEQSMGQLDPWFPPFPPCPPTPDDIDFESCRQIVHEWFDEVNEIVAASRRTQIIAPDRTPESLDFALAYVLPRLSLIFEKDSTRSFLRLFQRRGFGMLYGFIITPLTFTTIIKHNALRCAKVALESKAQALRGFRANPNCMIRYGYFPLHEAAELFCVDMIKLLFRYGANANVRTAGDEVIEGLLPLHVAVENTCLHRYLEGNAFPNEEDLRNSQATVNYICKLIHLLCLPEVMVSSMLEYPVFVFLGRGNTVGSKLCACKIFLDSIRLLGKHTDNLVDEINGNGKPDGFYIIISHILSHTISLVSGTGQNGKKKKQLEVEKTLTHAALLLVHAVCQAGESLDKYIMSHPEGQFHLNNDSQSTDSYLNTGNVPLGAFLNNPLFAQTNSYM
ncbi:hypothetical protein U9M48_032497 [Paspalum notatum var. saurae]|uniref:Uncharacterized protein n=1 Tax=Paspalum notatum var. saurae TaxID=547442 RepID=A0AAQ3X5T7_PASNO